MIKINYSHFRYLIVMLLLASSLVSAQFGPMPGAGPMGMPGGAPQGFGPGQAPAGGMPTPTEQELEQILKMIEQAAAENPELIKEWERQGQREILKMSEADLAAFGQMVGIAPSVLREEAEKALADELGTTPTAPQAPAAFEEEFTPQRPPAPQKLEQPAQPKPSKAATHQTSALIQGILKNLTELQTKAASVREVHELIRAWLQELRELMFYLSVIDRHEYHEHLSLPKFKNLSSALSTLYNALRTEVPAIALPDDLIEEPTAYDILGVKKSAKDATIDAIYEQLSEKHDPKKLEKQLRAQGLDEKAIKQQVKKATLSFEAVEDAYEQLHNPQLRAQVDREIEAHKGLKQQKIAQATQALKNIRYAFEEAIYGNELLFGLEEFLQDYAPQQLALKKTMEEAEAKRLEEQKKQASITPSTTYGRFEPDVRYAQTYDYDDYGYGSNFNPYSDYGYDYYPDYSYGSDMDYNQPSGTGKGSGSAGGPAEEKKEKEDKGKKEDVSGGESSAAPSAKNLADARKIDQRTPDEIIKSIDKNFDEFIKNYVKDPVMKTHYKTMLDGFSTSLTKAPAPTPATTAPQPQSLQQQLLALEQLQNPTAQETAQIQQLKQQIQNLGQLPAPQPPVMTPQQQQQLLQAQLQGAQPTAQAQVITLPSAPDISKNFEDFRKNLKIDALAHDTENLIKVFKKLGSKSKEQEKALKKLAEKIDEHEDVIPNLRAQLDGIASDVTDSEVQNNIDAYKKLSEDLTTINENFDLIQEKYTSKI